jgi:hypothetical protein
MKAIVVSRSPVMVTSGPPDSEDLLLKFVILAGRDQIDLLCFHILLAGVTSSLLPSFVIRFVLVAALYLTRSRYPSQHFAASYLSSSLASP